jgi:hypothetical protein
MVTSENELPSNSPAVIVPPTTGNAIRGTVSASAHPVTAIVNWSSLPDQITSAGDMPRGWVPILRLEDRPIVAVHEGSVREVWVGFDAPLWATTPDYVIFWANVFSWVGHGQERFAGDALALWNSAWTLIRPRSESPSHADGTWPGIYRTQEGGIKAFNSPEIPADHPAVDTPDWRQRLASPQGPAGGAYPLGTIALLMAIASLVAAAIAWKRLP